MDKKTASQSLQITSYNIHKGYCASNRRFILSEIREAIRQLNPDILFYKKWLGTSYATTAQMKIISASQFEYLAEEIWPHHVYGKNAIYIVTATMAMPS